MIIDRDLKPVRTPAQKPYWRLPRPMLACGIAALVLGAPAQAQLRLPPPGPDPLAIDFTTDPVLAFVDRSGADADFRAAVAAAATRHPSVAEAGAASDEARAARRETRAALFPAVNASIIASRSLARDFEGNSAIVESLIPRGRTDAALGADQLLYDFGATGSRIAGGTARLRAARAEADRAATTILLSAIEAWYRVAGQQALVELADTLVIRHRRILADTRSRVDAGLGTGGDIARAEAGLAEAITDAARRAQALAAVRAGYRQIFGSEAAVHPLRAAPPPSAARDADGAIAMSQGTPAVIGALAIADAARAEARAERGDARPRLSAGIVATRYNAFERAGEGGGNYDVRGQIMLRQSLSAGGAEAARIAQAEARARAAGFAGERVAAETGRNAAAAHADARILDGAAPALADAYRANRRVRDAMAEQLRLSRGTLIELLRAEQDYAAAAVAMVAGSIERDLARYTLLARTGELPGVFTIGDAK